MQAVIHGAGSTPGSALTAAPGSWITACPKFFYILAILMVPIEKSYSWPGKRIIFTCIKGSPIHITVSFQCSARKARLGNLLKKATKICCPHSVAIFLLFMCYLWVITSLVSTDKKGRKDTSSKSEERKVIPFSWSEPWSPHKMEVLQV